MCLVCCLKFYSIFAINNNLFTIHIVVQHMLDTELSRVDKKRHMPLMKIECLMRGSVVAANNGHISNHLVDVALFYLPRVKNGCVNQYFLGRGWF